MATTKAERNIQARKNAEAEKARKKTLRDQRTGNAQPPAKNGKKGPSLINQSKAKKKK